MKEVCRRLAAAQTDLIQNPEVSLRALWAAMRSKQG